MKKLILISISIVGLVLLAFTSSHDFHTSTTKVELNSGDSALTFTSKFVTEDLEKAVNVSADNAETFDQAVEGYLQNNFRVKVNGEPKSYIYAKSQTSPKATRVYFEIPDVYNVREIEIMNAMLIEEFPEQQNFMTFDINGKRESFVTKKGSITGTITF